MPCPSLRDGTATVGGDVIDTAGLEGMLRDLATVGFTPLATQFDPRGKLLSFHNVAAIVSRTASSNGITGVLPASVWDKLRGSVAFALVPASQSTRLQLALALSDWDALRASAPTASAAA